MDLSVLEVGNRVDITSINKKSDDRNARADMMAVTSEIRLFSGEYSVVIDMPKFKDKIVVLSDNTKYVFTILSSVGSYRGIGIVTRRFKKDDKFYVEVTFENGVEKFQRREYFRLDCKISAVAFSIDKKGATSMSMSELRALVDSNSLKGGSGVVSGIEKIDYNKLKDLLLSEINNFNQSEPIRLDLGNKKEEETIHQVTILDISGGGARFRLDESIDVGSYVVLRFSVEIEGKNTPFYIAAEILKCSEVHEGNIKKYECRSKFTNIGPETKKLLTKYIFDEDRKARS
ncbi:MAG: PilZ domain-containing protein [Lachnospiraceae bacterium]|nr:PilZ domain-containing protein [Lachnospiraceae bacterium]